MLSFPICRKRVYTGTYSIFYLFYVLDYGRPRVDLKFKLIYAEWTLLRQLFGLVSFNTIGVWLFFYSYHVLIFI